MKKRTSRDFYRLDNGTLTAIRFGDKILGPIVRYYAAAVGHVYDNDWLNMATASKQLVEDEGMDTIEFLQHSFDLNPTEHLWDIYNLVHLRSLCCTEARLHVLVHHTTIASLGACPDVVRHSYNPYKLLRNSLRCCIKNSTKYSSLLHHFALFRYFLIQPSVCL